MRRAAGGRKGRCSINAGRYLKLNEHTRNSVRTTRDRKFIIVLPATLDFEKNYEVVVSHFQTLRAANKQSRLRNLGFQNIRHISPSAALVLASEVDRWNQRTGGRLKALVDTWHEDVKRLLCQMGYFELLQITVPPAVAAASASTTFLPFKRGDLNDRNAGLLAKKLRIEIEGVLGFAIKKHFLFEGLSEAITNVGQHAYPDANSGAAKQWWVSASYDKKDRRLCVMFYDQGAGIPVTLPSSEFFENLKELFNTWVDSQKIEAAMQIGRSASENTERGKGLQNLTEFAKSHAEGQLSIYSLRGMYRLVSKRNGGNSVVTTERRDFKNSIGGTLIEWAVRL